MLLFLILLLFWQRPNYSLEQKKRLKAEKKEQRNGTPPGIRKDIVTIEETIWSSFGAEEVAAAPGD